MMHWNKVAMMASFAMANTPVDFWPPEYEIVRGVVHQRPAGEIRRAGWMVLGLAVGLSALMWVVMYDHPVAAMLTSLLVFLPLAPVGTYFLLLFHNARVVDEVQYLETSNWLGATKRIPHHAVRDVRLLPRGIAVEGMEGTTLRVSLRYFLVPNFFASVVQRRPLPPR